MKLHVVFAGMLDDPYLLYVWLLLPVSILSTVLCLYRYKIGYVVIPMIAIVAALFLRYFLAPDTYRAITTLSHAMPWLIALTIGSVVLPIVSMYFGWRRTVSKRAAAA